MSKVFDADELPAAVELALQYGAGAGGALHRRVESTVAVLQGQALPSIRIETPRVFYDYRAKYESDNTNIIAPEPMTRTWKHVSTTWRSPLLRCWVAPAGAAWIS